MVVVRGKGQKRNDATPTKKQQPNSCCQATGERTMADAGTAAAAATPTTMTSVTSRDDLHTWLQLTQQIGNQLNPSLVSFILAFWLSSLSHPPPIILPSIHPSLLLVLSLLLSLYPVQLNTNSSRTEENQRLIRADHRTACETRGYQISHGYLAHNYAHNNHDQHANQVGGGGPDGSALVSSDGGGTMVIAAVTCQVGQTTATAPGGAGGGGDVVVHVRTTLGQVESAGGSGGGNNGALQAILQRIAEASVDVDRLQLLDGHGGGDDAADTASSNSARSSWAIRLDITLRVLDSNGNLLDVCIAAMTAALVDTIVPLWNYNENEGLWYQQQRLISPITTTTATTTKRRVPFKALACALSAVGYHDRDAANHNNTTMWLVDPTREERALGSTVVTVVVDASTGDLIALEMTPSGDDDGVTATATAGTHHSAGVAVTDLHQMIEMTRQHAKRLRPLLLLLPPPSSSPPSK
jgi:3' exoribonuclease family, domain 1